MNWRRLLIAGLSAAALCALGGIALEYWWFGPTDLSAAQRVERLVRRQFDDMTSTLTEAATSIATNTAAVEGLASSSEATRSLFDLLAAVRARTPIPGDIAITVYDDRGVARAWTGRPSELATDRTGGQQDLFVTRTALGLRLVHIHPIVGGEARRLGAVAAEHVLSRSTAGEAIAPSDDSLPTPVAPVTIRLRAEGGGERLEVGSFLLYTPAGAPLVEVSASLADLQHARADWRRTVVAWTIVIVGITMLLLIGPLLDARTRTRNRWVFVRLTAAASLLLLGGLAAIAGGLAWSSAGWPDAPVLLVFSGTALATLAALWVVPATRLQATYRTSRPSFGGAPILFVAGHLLAGIGVAALILSFGFALLRALDPSSVDVRHFSLYPWNGPRVLQVVGLLALHLAVLWSAGLILIAARAMWRLPRRSLWTRGFLLFLWLAPTAAAATLTVRSGTALPVFAIVMSAAACGITALLARRIVTWYRHATIASRIFALFLAFLVPAILLYPSLDFFAERAVERLISTEYSVSARDYYPVLQGRLKEALQEIDALPGLDDLVADAGNDPVVQPTADPVAFSVWKLTVLARERLTSAVELYDRRGTQISRFALNLPEYTAIGQQPQSIPSCDWDVFGEPLPIGSDERYVLHAERSICDVDNATGLRTTAGSIIIHVAYDFRDLPFMPSQSPYFELFRPSEPGRHRAGTSNNDLRVALYSWVPRPVYTSGLSAWPLSDSDPLFARIYDPERRPFWETVPLGDDTYRVHFSNDRFTIYAIGYRRLTLFDHLVHVAELTTLAGAAFVLVLVCTAIFTRASRERPRVGRALFREIRASFYRKLFLAFVLVSIIPVLTLALVIRAYFAELLRNDIQAEAARTASVAQRVLEESDAIARTGAGGVDPNDDVMVWIRQVINQDINLFQGPDLVATSERDLFQSGLLPTRTPDDVYRAIALQHAPSFVDEDQLGGYPYLIAATPVTSNRRDYILTVPLAARQQEIDRQRYDLDRGVHLAVLGFILFGAAIGLSLAERIADPVRRLTRASQRIGRGDFDARIAVRSVDELRRLVDAFNSMAAELKAQRAELERTHRLEAWAEMARQVAHEIKNPLTPIQLSAEHLRRVHDDRGKPLGAVLEGCVTAILGQVRLLRQIAAEFSSFASSPHTKPPPVDLTPLVAEVIDPYRAGLTGRIDVQNHVIGPLPLVLVDRTLIMRALANIVENALHAMPGTGQLIVDSMVEENGEFVSITVRDTGVGMDADALARVFEPYFSTKASGTGLGLPIARRNIELNGGTVDVESKKGVGTAVKVRFRAYSVLPG